LLEPIANARRLVVFKSLRDAQRALEIMGQAFDIIGYNLETGPATPPDEQANPVEAVRFMSELAAQNNKLVAIGPDRNFALTYGPQIAPYVDIFVIQVQRIQTEPDLVRAYVEPLAVALRKSNPDIQISIQVRTEGDVVALVDMIESLGTNLDGVSILTSPETVDVAEALVNEIRSRAPARAPATAPSPSPAASPTPPAATASHATTTLSLAASSTHTATPKPSTEAPLPSAKTHPLEEPALVLSPRVGGALAAALLAGAGSGALLVALIIRATRRG
jgi:inosine-uridine nucleoside N-ribohydrolase